jgi:hypothetical protein
MSSSHLFSHTETGETNADPRYVHASRFSSALIGRTFFPLSGAKDEAGGSLPLSTSSVADGRMLNGSKVLGS